MSHPDTTSTARPLPVWVLLVVPLVTFVLASTDALLLAVPSNASATQHWKAALLTTIPLSAAACALSSWILLRLRNEIDRRGTSESRLRTALGERDVAIAELSQGLAREQRLRRELDHRVRNNLASLLGLVGLYEGSNVEPTDLVRSLRGRISALREVYGLISAATEGGVGLAELLNKIAALTGRTSLTHRARERSSIQASGPSVWLSSREANALAMVLQELFTNAGKHGALREPDGVVNVTWSLQPARSGSRLELEWVESPVPHARSTRSGGLGLTLIEGIVRSDLRGHVRFDAVDGRWRVSITAVLSDSTAPSSDPTAPTSSPKHQEVRSP